MHAHRKPADHPAAPAQPMRAEDVRRMLDEADLRQARARRRGPLRRFLQSFCLVFTLYVLSIGPLYWKWYGAKSGLASPFFLVLYAPLEQLARQFPPLGHLLNWYVSLWIY